MKRTYYVDGNTVRELDDEEIRRRHRTKKEIEQEKRQKNRRKAVRRNREKALGMNKGYVAFLTVCVCLSAFAAVSLIRTQASVTQKMKHVAALESQIEDLQTDNDARYKEITNSVDLNYVKDVAINQLGMTYATEDQVVYYSVDKDNYMDQYSDIPE